jgi:peptide subunit release factor 1 (eRF1)
MTPYWRDELRQLAGIESSEGCAISFFFQPSTPQDRSHRGETILVRDLVRDALKNLDRTGEHARARGDLERILAMADQLHNNHSRAKAIFACAEHGLWKEYDLPAAIQSTGLHVNNRFHLTPVVAAVSDDRQATIVLIDRENARILELDGDLVTEKEVLRNELPRRGRSDGFRGYEGGHLERHVDNEAMRHFKEVAERLKEMHVAGRLPVLLVGCRAELWSEIETHFHPYLRQALVARLDLDPTATLEKIREEAFRVLDEQRHNELQGGVREVLGEAQRNGRGSVGLHHVLTSLERGEVQKLFIGRDFSASVVECVHCGHLDTRHVKQCAVCAKPTREADDAVRALLGHALRNSVQILYVADDAQFHAAGNIAALLRFRADQNTPAKTAGSEAGISAAGGTPERAAS